MSGERFTNARVHEWLTGDLDKVVDAMHTTRVLLNSAALWWFCRHLSAEERAEILGEYVKVQAMGGEPSAGGDSTGSAADSGDSRPRRRPGRRRKSEPPV